MNKNVFLRLMEAKLEFFFHIYIYIYIVKFGNWELGVTLVSNSAFIVS